MRSRIRIAITGHRPNKLCNDYDLTTIFVNKIELSIVEFIRFICPSNNVVFITGMALGIDTLFAQIAVKHNIPFIAAIPCEGQHNVWPQKSQERYLDLINHPLCTKQYVSLGNYSPQKMQLRNQWMVDNCDILLAVWDGSEGGTKNCINYAVKVKKTLFIFKINALTQNIILYDGEAETYNRV